jgi:hypothetical protein
MQLINGDSVKIRPIVTGDTRYLSGKGGDNYQTYYNMIERLVVEPKVEVDDLLLDDVNAILFIIRIMSFGEDYEIEFDCISCQQETKKTLKLSDLSIINAHEKKDYNPSSLEIKLSKNVVKVHAIRLKDEKAITRKMEDLSKLGMIHNEFVDRLYVRYAQLIDEIDGEPQAFFKKKMEFIDNLSPMDMDELSYQIDQQSIGVVQAVSVDCDHANCGKANNVRIGVNANFFRTPPRR